MDIIFRFLVSLSFVGFGVFGHGARGRIRSAFPVSPTIVPSVCAFEFSIFTSTVVS